MTKKITRATFKSFVNKNKDNLMVRVESSFNGMTDGVEYDNEARFYKPSLEEKNEKYTLGVQGVWLVGNSRDTFNAYEDNYMEGISVYNACGSFVVAVKKGE